MPTPPPDELFKLQLRSDLTALKAGPPTLPPDVEILLAPDQGVNDEVVALVREYFAFKHSDFAFTGVDRGLLACLNPTGDPEFRRGVFATPCVTLEGVRGSTAPTLRNLFVGDLVWLFFFDRMGVFKILGALLEDYAIGGRSPMSGGDLPALILETMTRHTKMGVSSTVRDREASFRRCLGWTSESGRKLELDSLGNTGFNELFHSFIRQALLFYDNRRLAAAIRGPGASPAPPSIATLKSISDTVDLLRAAFEPFGYGRNFANTATGIVWALATIALVRDLRGAVGIPLQFAKPSQYMTAAYDLLVLKRSISSSASNRYTVHKECASYGRDLLLDLQVLPYGAASIGSPLELWLNLVEDKVEGYRMAYRALTSIDLGPTQAQLAAPAAHVEQQLEGGV